LNLSKRSRAAQILVRLCWRAFLAWQQQGNSLHGQADSIKIFK
jgi:hypothetical protein